MIEKNLLMIRPTMKGILINTLIPATIFFVLSSWAFFILNPESIDNDPGTVISFRIILIAYAIVLAYGRIEDLTASLLIDLDNKTIRSGGFLSCERNHLKKYDSISDIRPVPLIRGIDKTWLNRLLKIDECWVLIIGLYKDKTGKDCSFSVRVRTKTRCAAGLCQHLREKLSC